jgi:hypothetical protein
MSPDEVEKKAAWLMEPVLSRKNVDQVMESRPAHRIGGERSRANQAVGNSLTQMDCCRTLEVWVSSIIKNPQEVCGYVKIKLASCRRAVGINSFGLPKRGSRREGR